MNHIQSSRFALIGAAGYIAPRHMAAIRYNAGDLTCAFDISDSVGIIDRHFPDAAFFNTFEQFCEYVYSEKAAGRPIEYIGICSPNFLHKSHIDFALRAGADAICEKPLVLDPKDLDAIAQIEQETSQRVNTILQLRLHKAILELRDKIKSGPADKIYDVDLSYFTSRGAWYHASWKGLPQRSGGIATNIGIHFYDMLCFVFGPIASSVVHHRSEDAAAGYLEFERARVRWILSINRQHLPERTPAGCTVFRSLNVDGEELEFSDGFTELHTKSYKRILAGEGFGIEEARPSVELASQILHATTEPNRGERHPELARIVAS